MYQQNVVVYCYWSAQYNYGYHGSDITHPYGPGAADGPITEDHVDRALQRRVYVRYEPRHDVHGLTMKLAPALLALCALHCFRQCSPRKIHRGILCIPVYGCKSLHPFPFLCLALVLAKSSFNDFH